MHKPSGGPNLVQILAKLGPILVRILTFLGSQNFRKAHQQHCIYNGLCKAVFPIFVTPWTTLLVGNKVQKCIAYFVRISPIELVRWSIICDLRPESYSGLGYAGLASADFRRQIDSLIPVIDHYTNSHNGK